MSEATKLKIKASRALNKEKLVVPVVLVEDKSIGN